MNRILWILVWLAIIVVAANGQPSATTTFVMPATTAPIDGNSASRLTNRSYPLPVQRGTGPCENASLTWKAVGAGEDDTSWTGGLGLLMNDISKVWMCRIDPSLPAFCGGNSSATIRQYPSMPCYVYNEIEENFMYWGPNTEIFVVRPSDVPSNGDGSSSMFSVNFAITVQGISNFNNLTTSAEALMAAFQDIGMDTYEDGACDCTSTSLNHSVYQGGTCSCTGRLVSSSRLPTTDPAYVAPSVLFQRGHPNTDGSLWVGQLSVPNTLSGTFVTSLYSSAWLGASFSVTYPQDVGTTLTFTLVLKP